MNLIPCFECFASLFKILKLFVKFLNYHGGVCSRDTWATNAIAFQLGTKYDFAPKFKGSWMKAFVSSILTLFWSYELSKTFGRVALMNGSLCDLYFDSTYYAHTAFKNNWESGFHEWEPLWFVFWLCFGPRNLQKHLGGLHKWMIPSICGKHFDSITNLREFYNSFEMSLMSYFDDLFDILFWFYS